VVYVLCFKSFVKRVKQDVKERDGEKEMEIIYQRDTNQNLRITDNATQNQLFMSRELLAA
jgi:hypothetical protein